MYDLMKVKELKNNKTIKEWLSAIKASENTKKNIP
jgi:hypothetical protein